MDLRYLKLFCIQGNIFSIQGKNIEKSGKINYT